MFSIVGHESMFSASNKKETAVMEQFFQAFSSSSQVPTLLASDAQDVLNLLKADVNSVTAIKTSLDKVNQILDCYDLAICYYFLIFLFIVMICFYLLYLD